MTKVKHPSFEGQTIFCGIDVHKKSWKVNIRNAEFELESYSQDPCEESLSRHLRERYPGADYQVAYEAGFCGFSIQRSLERSGLKCIIVNPADVPSSDKDKKRKSDRIDARKICRELSNGQLKGIFVPEAQMEQARTLIRQRSRLVQDQTRCKNRISHLLMFSGLKMGADIAQQRWSEKFIEMLRKVPCETQPLRYALDTAIEEYLQVRKLLAHATKHVRDLSKQPSFIAMQKLLQGIPGIGIVNAMTIMTELQDMRRFGTLDKLCSYVGIVPDTASSGGNKIVKGITHRSNGYLRPAIVESSWVAIRKDPAMMMLYKRYCCRMVPNKAIIKIARHLLSRIRYVWLNQMEYEIGIVG